MIRINDAEFRAFADQLRGFPKELRRGLRKNIKAASQDLVRDIQSNASWSTRIPSAVKTRVGFGQRSAGVRVFVDSRIAPHARPLEFGSQGRSNVNRHPVFGTDVWVDQPTRPFFMKAVRSNQRQVVSKVQDAIDDSLRRL